MRKKGFRDPQHLENPHNFLVEHGGPGRRIEAGVPINGDNLQALKPGQPGQDDTRRSQTHNQEVAVEVAIVGQWAVHEFYRSEGAPKTDIKTARLTELQPRTTQAGDTAKSGLAETTMTFITDLWYVAAWSHEIEGRHPMGHLIAEPLAAEHIAGQAA